MQNVQYGGHEQNVSRFTGNAFFSPEFISKGDPPPSEQKNYCGGCLLKLHFWMWDHPGILSHLKIAVIIDHSGDKKDGISGSYWSVQLFTCFLSGGEKVAGIHCKLTTKKSKKSIQITHFYSWYMGGTPKIGVPKKWMVYSGKPF